MLEAASVKGADQVSSFSGAVFERFCGNDKTSKVNKVFLNNMNSLKFAFKYIFRPRWTNENIASYIE